MYVCVCKAVTEKHIAEAIRQGASCMKDLRNSLGVTKVCGKCSTCARDCLRKQQGMPAPDSHSSFVLAEAS